MLSTCLIPRLVVGEPCVSQLMDRIAQQVMELVVGDLLRVIDVRKHDLGRAAIHHDPGCLAAPIHVKRNELVVCRLVDAVKGCLDCTFHVRSEHKPS